MHIINLTPKNKKRLSLDQVNLEPFPSTPDLNGVMSPTTDTRLIWGF